MAPSRRAFLAASGTVAAAVGWYVIDRSDSTSLSMDSGPGRQGATTAYVDHDGWIVSPEDKRRIDASIHALSSD